MKKKAQNRKKTIKHSGKNANNLKAFRFILILVSFSAGLSLAVFFINSNRNITASGVIPTEIIPAFDIDNKPEIESVFVEDDKDVKTVNNVTPKPVINPGGTVSHNIPVTNTVIAAKPAVNAGTLAFVIDDAGNNLRELDPFLRLPFHITIAVLPGLPNSAEAARRIRAAGKEVILHQPMEAVGAQNPGPGAIYSNMGSEEMKEILAKNIAEVGPVAGINNHQGSKITMDMEAMLTVISFCRENNIYFLDSRTTAQTAAPAAAQMLGIKIGQRDIFIDNEQDKDSMLKYIESGLEKAQKNGNAVMIGHTWSPALAPLLAEQFSLLSKKGYNFKTVSDIIYKK